MSANILSEVVAGIREAAGDEDRSDRLRVILKDSLADTGEIADAIAATDQDEVLSFEDETCSAWTCRFSTDPVFPLRERRIPVHIAVFRGTEVQVLYKRAAGRLIHGGTKPVNAGDPITLGPKAIHAICGEGEVQSHAIHIYAGPLMLAERSLFDWETGAEVDFTMENFHALTRRRSEMVELR